MKKKDLTKLAIMGIASGCLIGHQALHGDADSSDSGYSEDKGNYGYKLMSEDELLLELNEKGTELYMSLSEEGKELARKVASQRCNGSNICKGLNACRTENNACAGEAECKGQGKCSFSDKNLAVKVVAQKMAEKRKEASQ